MKITGFNPIVITPKFDDAVKVFEDLGFEKKHAPVTDTGKHEVRTFRMKNESGFVIDVSDFKDLPRDLTYVRINADDFDVAYIILAEHGFKNTRGDDTLDSKSYKEATMVSPSGLTIALVKHIKEHE